MNKYDPSGHFAISTILIPMLIGFAIGSIIGGGFEIIKQIYDNGWNPTDWNWKKIGLSTLGGGVAGAISAIPIPGKGILSYIGTFAIGGIASMTGGLISGSVDSWQSAIIAFMIGGTANIVARGVTSLINKRMMINAKKQLSNIAYEDITLYDLIGTSVKNNGIPKIYLNILNKACKLLSYSNGEWTKSIIYAALNSSISSLTSGWY